MGQAHPLRTNLRREPRLKLLRNTSETAGLRVGRVCKYTPLPLALVSCVLHQNLLREEPRLDLLCHRSDTSP